MSSCHIRTRVISSGEKRYVVRYRRAGRGTRVEHAGSFRTMKEANLRKTLVLEWLASGKNPADELALLALPKQASRFPEFADAWLAGRYSISDSTRETYRGYMALMKERFKDRDPARLTPADVSAWVGVLVDEGREPSTIGGYVKTLAMILDSLPGENPARKVELPRKRRREPEPPDANDVLELLTHTTSRYVTAIVFLEQTGARVSEAIGVARRDVDGGRVRFRADESKGNVSRWVDCPEWLLELMPLRGVERTALGNAMRRASERAKIDNVHPHLLRHRRATLWHQSGLPAVELAYRLGHAKPSMSLDVYSHVWTLHEVDPSVLREAVEARM